MQTLAFIGISISLVLVAYIGIIMSKPHKKTQQL